MLRITLILSLLLMPTLAGADVKPIRQQIVEIVTSSKDTIRKWTYSPAITVVYDTDPRELFIRDLAQQIEQIDGFPGFSDIRFVDIAEMRDKVFQRARFSLFAGVGEQVEPGRHGHFVFETEAPSVLSANIFLFLLAKPEGTLFSALTATAGNAARVRYFASNRPHGCYYQSFSREDVLHAAIVHVNNFDDELSVQHCLYEEFMHTMGILQDSEGSPYFTFDDRPSVGGSRHLADFALLRALYDPAIPVGSHPDAVAERFVEINATERVIEAAN